MSTKTIQPRTRAIYSIGAAIITLCAAPNVQADSPSYKQAPANLAPDFAAPAIAAHSAPRETGALPQRSPHASTEPAATTRQPKTPPAHVEQSAPQANLDPKNQPEAQNPAVTAPADAARVDDSGPADVAPAPPLTFEQKVAAAVRGGLKAGAPTLTKEEKDALTTFYSAPEPTLLWVSQTGMTESARHVIAELQNADAFGLKASSYKIPKLDPGETDPEVLGKAELTLMRSVMRYARHAKGGRVAPGQIGSQLTQSPPLMAPEAVVTTIKNAGDPAAAMRGLHPQHPQFIRLREKLAELRGDTGDKKQTKLPEGPTLRKGMKHDHVALLRARLNVPASGDTEKTFDDALETAVKEFQKKSGSTADGIVGPGTRRALNGVSNTKLIKKILLNMERWRWLPEDLNGNAELHVWVNLPEFRVRVMKGEETAFSERAIIGLVTHKTPVFSDEMEWIEIHPTWFVPNSIKVNDILPSLRRKTSTVMERYNLKVNCGAAGTNPKAIDWNKIDITKCSFTQPAGSKSVLGDFKFKFPNKHAVYMHDTHKPGLFATRRRAYSHGCVRVDKPRGMAHVILQNDKGMSAEELDRIVDGPQRLRTEKLNRPVPVHMTYFTANFDDEGNLVTHPDIYGHDGRLAAALAGRGAIPKVASKKNKPAKSKKKSSSQQAGWWDNLF